MTQNPVGDATTMRLELYNASYSNTVYAYITGISSGVHAMLQQDGTLYNLPDISADQAANNGHEVPDTCGIKLPAPGGTLTVTVPYLDSGRIYFCLDGPMHFFVNTGRALCEPSVTNTSDPNYKLRFDKCEFTFGASGLYTNITMVDYFCIPIGLEMKDTGNAAKFGCDSVPGLCQDGLQWVAQLLKQVDDESMGPQGGWSNLVVGDSKGDAFRILSGSSGLSSLQSNYWQQYVENCWQYYKVGNGPILTVHAQDWGEMKCQTQGPNTPMTVTDSNGQVVCNLDMPTSEDVFGANSGPFASNPNIDPKLNQEILCIGNRINAALNRSTLTMNEDQPDKENVLDFYTQPTTNYYAKAIHYCSIYNLGYAHPYDDVPPAPPALNQSGTIHSDAQPGMILKVTVGGRQNGNTADWVKWQQQQQGQSNGQKRKRVKPRVLRGQQPAPSKFKRDLDWLAEDAKKEPTVMVDEIEEDEEHEEEGSVDFWDVVTKKTEELKKEPISVVVDELHDLDEIEADDNRDLEKGEYPNLLDGFISKSRGSKFDVAPAIRHLSRKVISNIRTSPFWVSRLQPVFTILNSFLISFLSLATRAILSRVFIFSFITLMYLFGGFTSHGQSAMDMEETRKRMMETVIALNDTLSGLQV